MMDSWVHEYAVIGENVRLTVGCVIGLTPSGTAANRRKISKNLSCVRLGDRVSINPFTCIYLDVHIGEDCLIGNHANIREGCRIGARCVIGAHVDLQYNVKLGNDVRILNQTQITGESSIGDGTFIGPGVQTANDPYLFHEDLDDYKDRGQVGVTIGKKVFIGVGAILLPGVKIGDGARIAAGALVAHDVPAGATMIGSPAKQRVEPPWPVHDGLCGAIVAANPSPSPNGDTGGVSQPFTVGYFRHDR